jgi:hypothetical protein
MRLSSTWPKACAAAEHADVHILLHHLLARLVHPSHLRLDDEVDVDLVSLAIGLELPAKLRQELEILGESFRQ